MFAGKLWENQLNESQEEISLLRFSIAKNVTFSEFLRVMKNEILIRGESILKNLYAYFQNIPDYQKEIQRLAALSHFKSICFSQVFYTTHPHFSGFGVVQNHFLE